MSTLQSQGLNMEHRGIAESALRQLIQVTVQMWQHALHCGLSTQLSNQ